MTAEMLEHRKTLGFMKTEHLNGAARLICYTLFFIVSVLYILAYVEVKEYGPLLSKLIYGNIPEKSTWLQNMLEAENETEIFPEKVFNYLKRNGKITSDTTINLLKKYVRQIEEPKDLRGYEDPGQILVPKVFRIQHQNHFWRDKQLPLLTAAPNGRTGNVMGEYITLYTLHRLYNVSVMVSKDILDILSKDFPHLSLNETVPDEDYRNSSLWHPLGNEGGTFMYGPFELAAAGLLGPNLFRLNGFGFEIQLFNLIRDEVVRELTFSDELQKKARDYLHSVAQMVKVENQEITYIGFHIRRTDYSNHMQVLFNGILPGKKYFQKALKYYRKKFQFPFFIVASDDKEFVRNSSLRRAKDVFISPGITAAEDMAILASCNHTIMTMGTYGFWCGYLAGGEVVYPVDTKLKRPYRINDRTYDELNLPNFTPMSW